MAGIKNIREGLTGNLTKLIVIAIVITFVGSIGWAGFFSQGNANIVAQIGSKQISNVDLNFELASQQFQINQRFPNQKIDEEVLVELSIESLIRKFGLLEFIENNNLHLSDSFVFTELAKNEQFQENGRFNRQIFDSFARSNGFIPQDYLNRIKQDLVLEFWKQSLVKSSFLPEDDVKDSIILAEQERDITFINLPLNHFSQELEISETALQEFYNNNINQYFTDKKSRVNYLLISSEDIESSIVIDELEIAAEYKIYADEFDTRERKSVSHIMVNVNSDRNREEAIKLLEDTKSRLSKGEDFSSLATELSDDEGTRDVGGSLGVTDGTLLPIEFEEALSSMNEGEVYGPIELNSSMHLIKLTKQEVPKPKSIESMRTQIEENLITEAAADKFGELIDRASDLVFSMGSLQAIAEELELVSIDSGLFSESEVNDDLNNPSILEIIFDTNLENNFIELIETSDQAAIVLERTEFQEEKLMALSSIKEKVTQDYELMMAKRIAEEFVDKALSDLNQGVNFSLIAESASAEVKNYKSLKRDSSLLTSKAITDIFNLPRFKAGNAYGASVSLNGDYLIYRLDSVKNNKTQMDSETQKQFSNYLSDERVTAEYTELLFAIQDNKGVTRAN